MSAPDEPLKVGVLGMDERSRNLLRLFFNGPCKGLCELVDHKGADVTLIDLDAYGGSNLKAKHDALYPGRPTILLSIQEKPVGESLWLSKPLNGKALLSTLTGLRKQIRPPIKQSAPLPPSKPPQQTISRKAPATSAAATHTADTVPPKPAPQPADAPAATNKQARRQPPPSKPAPSARDKTPADSATPGNAARRSASNKDPKSGDAAAQLDENEHLRYLDKGADINPTDPSQLRKVTYSTANLLQGYLQQALTEAMQTQRPVVVHGIWRNISIDPVARSVCYELSLSQLRSLCIMPTKESKVSIEPMTTLGECKPDRPGAKFDHDPLDAFLWQIALWTSRGRIRDDVDLKKPVFLTHWPNFTRLTVTPHALRIAALWVRQPYGLFETAKILQIPQRYVFAFYCAAQAIGLAGQGQRQSDTLIESPTPVEPRHKGLLGRILSRLRGA